MLFSAYDSDGRRELSEAFADAIVVILKAARRPLSESEAAVMIETIASNLRQSHDAGERDAASLRVAALRGIVASGRGN